MRHHINRGRIIPDNNTEPPSGLSIDNAAGCLVQTLSDSQKSSTPPSLQTTTCPTALQAIPIQSPTDTLGGNYTIPRPYWVSAQAGPEDFFNSLLSSAFRGAAGNICIDEQINEDILSRVILGEGWNAVFKRVGPVSCPLLAVLRYLDEAALQGCRPIDRLALLHAVHIMYLVWNAQISCAAEIKANGFGSLLS